MAAVDVNHKVLAPLEVLTHNRRGSITDPSLHAAGFNSRGPLSLNATQLPAPNGTLAALTDSFHNDTRPSAGYVFGDATPHSQASSESSSVDTIDRSRYSTESPHDVSKFEQMYTDPDRISESRSLSDTPALDYSSRKSSLALSGSSAIGSKRKMSSDRTSAAIDFQLAPPNIRLDDPEAPPPKRRGSAIDTQKIALLSLEERRNSVDSRLSSNNWWSMSDNQREPPTSVFSSILYSTDPGPTWHPNHSQSMPPLNFENDRPRTINPKASIISSPNEPASIVPSSHPDVELAGRSRDPPRPVSSASDRPSSPSAERLSPSSNENSGSTLMKLTKDSNVTPYSRSPELKVSHKLAERKRRKEMKELFDELRDELPNERSMKCSKWEILAKSIDLIRDLKVSGQKLNREVESMRREMEAMRHAAHSSPGNTGQIIYASPDFLHQGVLHNHAMVQDSNQSLSSSPAGPNSADHSQLTRDDSSPSTPSDKESSTPQRYNSDPSDIVE